ncbi:MAG: hypothetical protein JWO02_1742 [Solirubrobacterales bacterium]|nr:hypothetical protein [Solirubrobacterales bacterium]
MRSRRERRASRRRRCTWLAGFAFGAMLVALTSTTGGVWAAFGQHTGSTGNVLVAVPDFVAPQATAAVIQKTEGGTPGYIRQGGTYRVYANVTDSGNPASGVASATANVSATTPAQTAAALSAGAFTIAGQSYNERSASLTVNATLAATTYTYALTLSDVAANTRAQTGFPVIVDNTAPTASDVQTANKTGNTVRKPELGDTITFTYSEPIDPNSVVSGWTGSATNVVVRIDNDVIGSNDAVTVYNAANTAVLPFGTVYLGRNDYVSSSARFGTSGTPSTMTLSGNAISVTLGTATTGPRTAASSGTMFWLGATGATDRAGNTVSAGLVTEPGSSDGEF